MSHCKFFSFLLPFLIFISSRGMCQQAQKQAADIIYPFSVRMQDSLKAVSLPLLQLPARYSDRTLPQVIDNSKNDYWPGILDQGGFYSCEQYAGVAYTFGYEINRLRNIPGWFWENRYPAHYTWTFMNQGGQQVGVNFLQSFDLIKDQGHVTNNDFGSDTTGGCLGWTSGYDKYYHGMHNRLKQVYAIEINNEAGINTLRNYLFDHLDGSATGGIACFTTDSQSLSYMAELPPGTPEAGKKVVLSWETDPVHGLAIVGYNDSIRYDINKDGMFTNNLDINGDGVVDVKDWEIGAFKFANSYGTWWADTGFAYVLYSAMGSNFESGGVWNNRVYVVEADSAYHPLLTLKVSMEHNKRQCIRILAGVCQDTLTQVPEHVISFPNFNFQGGNHVMQGNDLDSTQKFIEFGLDITPLLNYIDAGKPARLFFGVEERDPTFIGEGKLKNITFISYIEGTQEFPVTEKEVPILDNNTTFVSTVATFNIPKVTITTQELPDFTQGAPYQVQLQASGGTEPYRWVLQEKYSKQSFVAFPIDSSGTALTQISINRPYTAKALPFPFPFYGKMRDSIYVNFYGFVSFDPQVLPAPYVTDEISMLKMSPVIAPAFSQLYSYPSTNNNGVYYQEDTSKVIIRWKTSNNFSLILYSDGAFEFRYGPANPSGLSYPAYYGISKGDGSNYDLQTNWNFPSFIGKAIRYLPSGNLAVMTLTPEGMLAVTQADTAQIVPVTVMVTDAEKISDSREFELSSGLSLKYQVVSGQDGKLKYGEEASLQLTIKNTGQQTLQNLALTLKSEDTTCIVSNNTYSLTPLNPGETAVLNQVFRFSLIHPLLDGYPVRFLIVAREGNRIWQETVNVQVAAPKIQILEPQLPDGNNNILAPGEVANLFVPIENSGSLTLQPVEIRLESLDTLIQVLSEPVQTLNHLDPFSKSGLLFLIKRSRYYPLGKPAPMRVEVTLDGEIIQTLNFSLLPPKNQVALIRRTNIGTTFQAMQTAMDSLHIGYDTIGHLNFDVTSYQGVFLIQGFDSHGLILLTNAEAMTLANYLKQHGNLYMEGYYTWYILKTPYLHPYFLYESHICPNYYFPRVNGIQSTFSDSMTFAFSGNPDFAYFSFDPLYPAYTTFVNTDDPPKPLEIVYDGDDYKTIGSLLEFGSLADSIQAPSTRQTLMKRYLDFFGIDFSGLHPLFHSAQPLIFQGEEVTFTDDSYDHVQSWQWEFPGGTPAISTLQNPVVRYNTTGKYDVSLTVSDGKNTRILTRGKYIQVKLGTGIEPVSTQLPFLIYPNPAHDFLTFEWKESCRLPVQLSLIDYLGKTVLKKVVKGENLSVPARINLSGLSQGVYVLRVQTPTSRFVTKVIVN
ncbi:MAG: T9SS type A sorting domain-containing protein [Bacteroidales bacterium]|nr:T9SS type A sorting domain-containing protein [Bacteroidales bacterium]